MRRTFKTKKLLLRLSIFAALLVALSSCLDEQNPTETETEITSMESLKVSENFSWETSQDITVILSATSLNPEFNSKISVFNGNPDNDGQLIINCGVSKETTFENEIQVPSSATTLYLKCEFPSGASTIDSVATSSVIEYTFNESTTKSASIANIEIPESPTCSDGCDETVTATSGNLKIEGGKTYCITEDYSGNITFATGGGTLRICGNATIGNVSNWGVNATIEVTSTGTLTTSNLSLYGSNQTLSNWGTIQYNGSFSPSAGKFNNYGTTLISSNLSMNGQGALLNMGQLNISGSFNNNSTSENSGTMQVAGTFANNSSSFINNCRLSVTGDFRQSAKLENSGYIYTGGRFIASSGTTEMIGGAMLETVDMTVNGTINGTGDYSSLSISGNTTITGSITGTLDICDENGIETNYGTIASTVTYCKNYIPVSDCNPKGIGEAPTTDNDNDGVTNNQDDYPEDSEKAYSSFFPNETNTATLVFEDLWPSKGDYDFNDLVASLKGKYVTNNSNKVIELSLTFKIEAVGAANKNGLGIQFDNITPSEVTMVSGMVANSASGITLNSNGTEANQSKAVVIAIQNVEDVLQRAGGSMFNTVKNGQEGTSDEVTIIVSFENNPVSIGKVKSSSFNFFLIKDQERGIEIHLADMAPTNLMTYDFGVSDDTSNPNSGRYYKTSNNLPWGLLMLEPFEHTVEKTPIIDAYSDFADWAQTGGASHANWYKRSNSSKIW